MVGIRSFCLARSCIAASDCGIQTLYRHSMRVDTLPFAYLPALRFAAILDTPATGSHLHLPATDFLPRATDTWNTFLPYYAILLPAPPLSARFWVGLHPAGGPLHTPHHLYTPALHLLYLRTRYTHTLELTTHPSLAPCATLTGLSPRAHLPVDVPVALLLLPLLPPHYAAVLFSSLVLSPSPRACCI